MTKKIRIMIFGRLLPIFLVIVISVFAAQNLSATPWEFTFGLRGIYDDNLLNYSDADLDLFDSLGSVSGGQFGIESKDDFIFNPSLDIKYKSKLFGHSFHAGLSPNYYFNIKNEKRRYFSGTIWAREYLRKGVYIQAGIDYLPHFYYRNLLAYDGFYHEANFQKIGASLLLNVTLKKRHTLTPYFKYEYKNFTDRFDERDSRAFRFGIDAAYALSRRLSALGGYEFAISRSRGRNNDDYRRDTSFDLFSFTGGIRITTSGISARPLTITPRLSYRIALYQTDKLTAEDRFRFGRKDVRLNASLFVRQRMGSRTSLVMGLSWLSNDADLPAADAKKYLDFTSFRVNIGFDYSF